MRLIMMGTGPFAAPTFRTLYDSPHEMAALVTCARAEPSRPKSPAAERAAGNRRPAQHADPRSGRRQRGRGAGPAGGAGGRSAGRLRLWPNPRPENARRGPLRRRQPARLAPAEVSWGGPNPMGHLSRRDRDGRDGHPHDAATRRRAVRRPASRAILADETAGELEPRLADAGAELVRRVVDDFQLGRIEPLPQDPALASKAPRLKKSDGLVDWNRPAEAIKNQIRAMDPWPKAYAFWHRPDGPPTRLILGPAAVVEPAGSVRRRARSWRPPTDD